MHTYVKVPVLGLVLKTGGPRDSTVAGPLRNFLPRDIQCSIQSFF